ncbi:MAG: hypothetical protein NTY31_02310 [Candidatus Falkowbacteria bacterium]|nr:hypothetical protein [Candidatus Falkowbacteria bacterium]
MLKLIHRYFRGRFERFYFKNHWHFVLDLSLTIIVICLAIGLIVLYSYRPGSSSGGPNVRPVLDLNNPPLSLELTPAEGVISLNDGSTLKMVFKNNGSAAINDLKLIFETSDNNFSLKKITDIKPDAGLNIDNQAITINNQTINFAKIPAGASGEAEVKVYFNSKGEGRVINWRARSEYSVLGQILESSISLPALKVKAELSVTSEAYYTSPQGDQLGIGPLPPLVGIPTNYWIFWKTQSLDNFKNLIVSARLPKGVELTDSRSLLVGEFNYNPDTRQLIWKVSELAGRADSYHLDFEVQLIPTANQVGQVLPLLNNQQYYATDSLTGEEVSGALDKSTTALDQDRFNSGQGQVVSE